MANSESLKLSAMIHHYLFEFKHTQISYFTPTQVMRFPMPKWQIAVTTNFAAWLEL
jgi:hypothetical protein